MRTYTNTHAPVQLAIECFEMAVQLNPNCEKFSEHLDEVQEALRQHEEVCTHTCFGSRNHSNSSRQESKLPRLQVLARAPTHPKDLCVHPFALAQMLVTHIHVRAHTHIRRWTRPRQQTKIPTQAQEHALNRMTLKNVDQAGVWLGV